LLRAVSHLAAGAGLVLTGRSVVDDDFWTRFRDHEPTSLAGVPHTFELLDRIGFGEMRLPSLRYVSQAGGRLDPAKVQRFAELGERRGWDLYVMYGQTEATARMAYLPPELARSHPGTIGVAVPGGALRIEPVAGADEGVGELVYRGPNVMLGYARGPTDLAAGRTVDELRTGDLARRGPDGLFEIVGRRSRFVKPFGLRIDLDQVERTLQDRDVDALCVGNEEHLVVATTARRYAAVARAVRAQVGLPASMVHVHPVEALPRLPNGKPDHAAVLALGRTDHGRADHAPNGAVAALFAEVLACRSVPAEATFVTLGGDSLSYVESSVRLEDLLGALPDEWPRMPVAVLEALAGRRGATGAGAPTAIGMETTVVLRAAAIVLVVATHAGLATVKGGAHLLLAVAGWNFARFQLPVSWARLCSSLARVVLPTLACVGVLLVVTDDYGLSNLVLLHTQFGSTSWDQRWRFWFVEAMVQILVVVGGLASVPALRRLEARFPFGFATALVAATVVLREVTEVARTFHRPQTVAWLFALGWAAQRATTMPRKLVVALLAIAAVHGFFHDATREGVVIGGVLLLLARSRLPMVAVARSAVAAVASASLFVYLTHWHVYPAVRAVSSPGTAVVVSVVVGVTLAGGWRRASEWLRTYRTATAGGPLRLARWGG
jgi:hypothetical protein